MNVYGTKTPVGVQRLLGRLDPVSAHWGRLLRRGVQRGMGPLAAPWRAEGNGAPVIRSDLPAVDTRTSPRIAHVTRVPQQHRDSPVPTFFARSLAPREGPQRVVCHERTV